MDNGDIVILSDDDHDEDYKHNVSCSEPSVLIVEVEDVQKIGKICV